MGDPLTRDELRKIVVDEIQAYLSTYRGAGTAELSKVGAELKSAMTRITADLLKKREGLVAALAVPGQVDHVIRTWGRAIFTGALMLAGVLGAAWLAIAATEQRFRWQVAKNAEIEEQIAAQERTLDQLTRRTGGLTLTGPDNGGRCFVLFPADADVAAVYRLNNRPAVEVECHE